MSFHTLINYTCFECLRIVTTIGCGKEKLVRLARLADRRLAQIAHHVRGLFFRIEHHKLAVDGALIGVYPTLTIAHTEADHV